MNKRRTSWIVGAIVLALLVTGVVALAGNGVRRGISNASQSATCLADRDADGDGIPNGQDSDWTAPADGSGYGATHGGSEACSGDCTNAAASAAGCTGQGGRAMRCGGGCL